MKATKIPELSFWMNYPFDHEQSTSIVLKYRKSSKTAKAGVVLKPIPYPTT